MLTVPYDKCSKEFLIFTSGAALGSLERKLTMDPVIVNESRSDSDLFSVSEAGVIESKESKKSKSSLGTGITF